MSSANQFRIEAERARETAAQAFTEDRAFWLKLAEKWDHLAQRAEAAKIRPWSSGHQLVEVNNNNDASLTSGELSG
jgi:hypothetical protein